MFKNNLIFKAALFPFAAAALFFFSVVFFTPRFEDSYSFTLYDRNGVLLGASVSEDMQWRFPEAEQITQEYKDALLSYEDRNFYLHFGIDPSAVLRAIKLNIANRKTLSGASTITMQTARLSCKNAERSLIQKMKEAVYALLFELRYSKNSILKLYASHAPFGGNVVGIEAASWRYFSRDNKNLTWAEICTLAVLPNQPSLVRPGKAAGRLKLKRDILLNNLCANGIIDAASCRLYCQEPVPEKPSLLPALAPHYLNLTKKSKRADKKNNCTLDMELQRTAADIAEAHSAKLAKSFVHNAAVIILDTHNGEILAYVGNTGLNRTSGKNAHVDMINARRSSGSLLKPFLYAGMLDAGMILPSSLMTDIPTRIGGYIPENNNEAYAGAVPADEALAKSLNIPFVRALREYTIPAFLNLLKSCGFTTFSRSAEEYGLPLILGGGELTMRETAEAYRLMFQNASQSSLAGQTSAEKRSETAKEHSGYPLSPAACYLTFEALTKANRPEEEAVWQFYASAKKIAWKTGTSFGWRDAWSIGVTSDYVVGVWIGNSDGEGRPEIRSAYAAAPVMFEIFSILPKSKWPARPEAKLERIKTCIHSGFPASQYCEKTAESCKPLYAPNSKVCPYCRPVPLTQDGKYRAHAGDIKGMPKIENRFVLPPAEEYFYSKKHPSYKPLPPWLPKSGHGTTADFEIIFPENGAHIFIPTSLDGSQGAFTIKAAHKNPSAVLYWDIDGKYLGKTRRLHKIDIKLGFGKHLLTLTDEKGIQEKRTFTILSE